jgi:hypothetical protein
MKDEELRERIQECFDDANVIELALSEPEISELIEILKNARSRMILGDFNIVGAQFLGTPNKVNSLFIDTIKVTRLHTFYKLDVMDSAEDIWAPSTTWTQRKVVDFERSLEIIYRGLE